MSLKEIAFATVVLASITAACTSTGVQQLKEESSETVSGKIVKGKSTKEDVRRAFGDPTETSFTDSGNELWRYKYSHAQSKPQNFIPLVNLFAAG